MNLIKLTTSLISIVIIIVGIALAAWTVIPDSSAHKVSALGYKSHCPFAPYSTIISVAIALFGLIAFARAGSKKKAVLKSAARPDEKPTGNRL